ncbi:MAG: hypothetical protein AAF571_10115 [Verrucomicrobiota bacterium]
MNTMIQCPTCCEELNHADWEANDGCCFHCGEAIESPSDWIQQRRSLGALRSRLELRPNFSRQHQPSTITFEPRRLYA